MTVRAGNNTTNITVNGTDYITEVNNGYANVSVYYLTEGEYNVSMTYYGDNKYNPTEQLNTTLIINKIPVSVKVTVRNESIFVGQEAILDINLTSNVEGYVVDGFVTVNVDNRDYNVSISNGTGYLTVLDLSNHTYAVSVNYGGDHQFINFTNDSAAFIYVNKVPISDITVTLENNVISVGEDAVYMINVNAAVNDYVVNGFVTVKVDNEEYNVTIAISSSNLMIKADIFKIPMISFKNIYTLEQWLRTKRPDVKIIDMFPELKELHLFDEDE